MANDTNVRDFLTAIKNEPLKLFRVYDITNRVSSQYEAVTHAKNGDPCMKAASRAYASLLVYDYVKS